MSSKLRLKLTLVNEFVSDLILEILNDVSREVILDCTSETESTFNEADKSFIPEELKEDEGDK